MTGYSKVDAVEETFPIREVVRLTGVNPVTLRAWERRYGLIRPIRTEGGHRQYSASDIETIRRIQAYSEQGVPVGKVGGLLAELPLPSVDSTHAAPACDDDDRVEWRMMLRQALGAFDTARLARLYGHAFSIYPAKVVLQDIFMPVWHELQEGSRLGQASQWAFLDAFLRARIGQRLQLAEDPGRQKIMLAPVSETIRELELLVTGLLVSCDAFDVTVLGAAQPPGELAYVCHAVQPAALVLFVDQALSDTDLNAVIELADLLPCPVALVGHGSTPGKPLLTGTTIACLGDQPSFIRQRLKQIVHGTKAG